MGMKKVIHPAGELIDFETVFEENTGLARKAEKQGHFERVEYTTDAYGDGVAYPKFCNVYLPWCYDPADKDRRYNVMYYQHGNTCDPDLFTEPHTKDLLDSMFASGAVEPCILVFTTYYFDVYKDVETRKKTELLPGSGGGHHPGRGADIQHLAQVRLGQRHPGGAGSPRFQRLLPRLRLHLVYPP